MVTATVKKYKSTIISIVIHLIILFLLFKNFKKEIFVNPNYFLPTSTVGYQVELIHADTNQQLKTTNQQTQDLTGQVNTNNLSTTKSVDIKLKSTSEKVVKQQQQLKHKQAKKLNSQVLKNTIINNSNNMNRNQVGVAMTNKNQVNIVASSPNNMHLNQVGDGGSVNSSTNGTGVKADKFDFRVIQYGRDAADAIQQNIVVPPKLANQYFTYRAFIRLNHNMQYESMVLVKSTGNADMDKIIAHALRETIYPPLPPGADFDQYKNIDFTIK